MNYNVTVNGKVYNVIVEKLGDALTQPAAPETPVHAAPAAPAPVETPAPAATSAPVSSSGDTSVNCPMPGTVFKIVSAVGQRVNEGDALLVLEAMKMEIEVVAPVAGTVKSINTTVGAAVNTDDQLVVLG